MQGNAEHMKHQAQDTAKQVRGEAQGMVEDAVHTVQENLHLQQQVQERPLLAAGAALVGGFLLGGMMGGGGGGQQHQQQHPSGAHTTGGGQQAGGQTGGGQQSGGMAGTVRNAAKKSGLEDTIENAVAALLGSVTEQLKGTMDQRFPGYSEKMQTAQQQGSFTDKARATQQEAQKR